MKNEETQDITLEVLKSLIGDDLKKDLPYIIINGKKFPKPVDDESLEDFIKILKR